MSKHDNEDLLKEFDELVSNGRMHLNLAAGMTIDDMTDEERLEIMNYVKEIEQRKANK